MLKKLARQVRVPITQQDREDIISAGKRIRAGRTLGSAGNVALLSSIPISILAKKPMMRNVGNVAAIGGVGSILAGMGLKASGRSKFNKVRQRKIQQARGLRKTAGGEYNDAYMLCKVLDSTAAQAMELKEKIAAGHELPSWAEYKIYKAGDSIKSALGSTYSMKRRLMEM